MNTTIDIAADDLATVWQILNKHLKPSIIKWAFGSRAKWSAKTHSDLDLALQDPYGKTIPFDTIAHLQADFEGSDLPWKVDIIDLNDIDEDFRKVVDGDKIKLEQSNPNLWKLAKLEDIAEIEMGQSPPGASCNNENKGYPLLNGPTEFGSYNPTATQFTTDPKRFSQTGDLLFCVRGSTTGRMNWSDQKYAIGRGIAAIRPKGSIEIQPYIRSLIEHHLPYLLGSATGSTFPNVSKKQLHDLEIREAPDSVKLTISEIIGSLDSKIELNRQINQTLESMAQAMFKSWFVDFDPVIGNALKAGNPIPEELQERADKRAQLHQSGQAKGLPEDIQALFPDRFVLSEELGWVPEGWEISTLAKYINVKHGFAFKGEYFSSIPTKDILLTPGNFLIGGGFKANKFKYYNGSYPKDYVLNNRDIVITMTDLSKSGDTLGYPAFIPFSANVRYLHNQRLGKVEIKRSNYSKEYLFLLLCSKRYRDDVLASCTGSTVRHTSPSKILAHNICYPGDAITNIFECQVVTLRNSMNTKNTETLVSLRETLLPKLISGELRIPEAEAQVQEALSS